MRLINTTTLEVEEFFDVSIPEYAILSHTWGDGEVSLQDWADRKNRRFKPGFQKIIWACNQAAKDQLTHVWVDTNCIDKSSSAELSEAINSMFRWYRRSAVCYVYLEDVPALTLDECTKSGSAFRNARWFTRGWTLQELIAPPNVSFFSRNWTMIATKSELAPCITEITGIPWSCLLKGRLSKAHPLRRYSVAQRMAWASSRSTTRIEDQAYSLLGLFDISMPLVYGEGFEAFTRLLGEIVQKYADHSFFASRLQYVDFLPRSPWEFSNSQSVVVSSSPQLQRHYTPGDHSYPFHLTNTGLQITLPIVPTLVPHLVFGVLECWDIETMSTTTTRHVSRIWIPLLRKGTGELQRYLRLIWPQTFFPVKMVRKDTIMFHEEEQLLSKGDEHLDTVSNAMQRSILIKKPYATILSVPTWQPREAGSPFLLCFPRGTADYRLYGIFPSDHESDTAWSSETPPLLPLIMPRRIHRSNHQGPDSVLSETGNTGIYAAVVVFKKKGSKPPRFVAIFLSNIIHEEKGRMVFEPRSKVIPNWSPNEDADLEAVDFSTFPDVEFDGDTLVMVQKIASNPRITATGREHRFVGLTQIIFDREQMMEDLRLKPDREDKRARGILQHYGRDSSDGEAND
ncbi:het domain-containing protein [Fusarium mexicanum]|uniref:Het domain-containing protein n=1 Tax=Fusarium mexicanum TaxID=751941 RepID=A0A8H5JTF5_9HYPO|nr:het domain-containing protein [Fusarium mexicanum]